MMSKRKLWSNILIGAAIGAAVSLLDKQTRDSVMENGKRAAGKTKEFLQNPGIVVDKVNEKVENFRATIEQAREEYEYFAEKVNELRETTPQLIEMVKETKEAFVKEDDEKKDIGA